MERTDVRCYGGGSRPRLLSSSGREEDHNSRLKLEPAFADCHDETCRNAFFGHTHVEICCPQNFFSTPGAIGTYLSILL